MGDKNCASLVLLSLVLLSGIFHLETIKLGFSLSGCKQVERKALLQFKESLTDPSGRLSSWVGEDCCSWRGVGCNNKTGNVVILKLNNPSRQSFDMYQDDATNELGGQINPSLLQLKELDYLDLSMNNFGGVQVPPFIGSLKKLRYLNLSGSYFGGTIPQSLGNLTNLLYLDLNNFLQESSEIDLGWLSGLSSLKYLNLGGADLSKAAGYWLEIVNMLHSLVELHLPNCDLPNLPLNFPALNFTSLSVLDLSNNGFNTTVPHWLSNISSLVDLDLNSNDLQGEIPDAFAKLNSLQGLDLSGNSFLGGQLSRNLGKLCNLRTLKLSRNGISGEVSDFINALSECSNSSLEELDLGFNQLTGNLPISMGYLTNLRYLELWHNSFQGLIPQSIGNLKFLKEFYISYNQMNGIFPESFGQLSALEVLDLSENLWEGVITEAHFINLPNLKDLSLTKESPNISLIFNISSDWIPPFKLSYINIRSCQLGPRFPTWLRNQNELTTLVLNNVGISDSIPDWFWKLDLVLDELDVAYNELRGRVPNSLRFRYPGVVDLSSNRFEGPLPLWSFNMTRAYLRNNSFSGPIPLDIGSKMPLLTDLDISFNFLNGSIAVSVGNLGKLLTLVISNNNLSGEIPESLNNITSLYILDMFNNNLSGLVPKWIGSLSSLRFLVLGSNNFSGELPSSLQYCTLMDSLDLE
ncbi:Leucine-rich repeat receptor protein kinase [Melia azedarach]|uniref:Leucine-rich repeat receptor protein kinase n=1 Tax=Melia azedarach TaxID=155640 RepID=A0ACC1Z1V0_MELAZ|nr:Leucine-rich repeat receptor protein kinase [Melia azedarach]